jgi:hypothetical protein
MGEVREWWANVYRDDAEAVVGLEWPTRNRCVVEIASGAKFRIHVRLKPEGAPKRYRDAANRRAWELYGDLARLTVSRGRVKADEVFA